MIATQLKTFKDRPYRWHIPIALGRCPVCHAMHKGDIFEPRVVDECLKYIRPDRSAIDAGACLGQMSVIFSRQAGKVYSFEAMPDIFNILKLNVEENKALNVEAFNNALWDVDGLALSLSMDIYGNNFDTFGGSSIDMKTEREIKVLSKTIDSLEIGDVSLIKIDVEGSEMKVLKGAAQTIQTCKPTIVFEHIQGGRRGSPCELNDIQLFFAQLGYKLRQLDAINFVASELA